jgi:3-polyprenyl-4-hydroxybenzoate decarboxylase
MKIPPIGLPVVASCILALSGTWGNSLSAEVISKVKDNTFKTELVNSCVSEATKQNVNEAQARNYCQCFADSLEKQDKATTQEFYSAVAAQEKPSAKVVSMIEGIVKTCAPR